MGGHAGAASRSKVISRAQMRTCRSSAVFAGPRYFTNMKVPFVQGRDFEERDREGAPCVAVINEAFGEKYFRGADCARKAPHEIRRCTEGAESAVRDRRRDTR